MSSGLELIRAILAEDRLTDDVARGVLNDALMLEVDPLDYCVRRLGVPPHMASARAAEWAGLAFHETVPRDLDGICEPARIDALAELHACRLRLYDRDVVFCAPDFFGFIRLGEHARGKPDLRARLCIVPPAALRSYLARCSALFLMDSARQRLARCWPNASAHLDLSMGARVAFVCLLLTLLACVAVAPFTGQPLLIALSVLIVGAPALQRIAAMLGKSDESGVSAPTRPDDAELPVYSVLLPLRDEAHMVPQLYRAMAAIDYPPEKLDIKFVVEADSPQTVDAARCCLHDPRFELVVVPPRHPHTKPKAMNYALPLVRGEHVVVFDAEDRPVPDQLWRAAVRFREEPALACLQAELVIDNGESGLLTSLFAGEYAALFGIVLPAQARWNVPVPLGGTSNHFRTQVLRSVGGWDSFNVTEDADLGVRLSRLGHRVETFTSQTLEEAPVTIGGWMAQRARWMKGWMQTFIVHNRQPLRLLQELGWRSFAFFQVMTLAMILAPILHVTFLVTAAGRLMTDQPLASPDTQLWAWGYFALFVLGNSAAFLVNVAGLARLKKRELLLLQLALPFYWVLLAGATLRAIHELLVRPFYWAKSSHRPARADEGHEHVTAVPETTTGSTGAERAIGEKMERVKGIEPSS